MSIDVPESANLEQVRGRWRTAVAGVLAKSARSDPADLGDEPEQRLPGTLAATSVCAWLGARIFRVHQVTESRQVVASGLLFFEASCQQTIAFRDVFFVFLHVQIAFSVRVSCLGRRGRCVPGSA